MLRWGLRLNHRLQLVMLVLEYVNSNESLDARFQCIARMCRAFTGMRMDVAGEMHVDDIKGSLRKLGLPATDANAHAMIK